MIKRGIKVNEKSGHVVANREKALFSHIWNFAREYGYTSKQNPCMGVKGFKETGRDVYIDDDLLNKVLACADKPTQFALRLAYLTGQRPADALKMNLTNIDDGCIAIQQQKTHEKVRIEIAGELKILLDEMSDFKKSIASNIHSLSLLIDEKGKPLTAGAFRGRFNKAREQAGIDKNKFQFRDMRAKAATDVDEHADIIQAKVLLGHTSEKMTRQYVRHRRGKKTMPVK